VVFSNVRSCFPWDSSYALKYECVISACCISVCVCVGVYASLPYLILMLWLYVVLRVCDMLFSCSFLYFPWPSMEIIFFNIGVYSGLCIGILYVF
jgi:hypothetical protein